MSARIELAVLPDALIAGRCRLRPLEPADADALATQANDAEIARWVRDRFPHPYTRTHARRFIKAARVGETGYVYAVVVDGELAGTIGLRPGTDVDRVTAEIGFWLGRTFRGRGLLPPAIDAVCGAALRAGAFTRIEAHVLAGNVPSARALERAGFVRESVRRQAVIKHGVVLDDWVYARLATD